MFWNFAPFFCFDLPISPRSTADFYQSSSGFVNKTRTNSLFCLECCKMKDFWWFSNTFFSDERTGSNSWSIWWNTRCCSHSENVFKSLQRHDEFLNFVLTTFSINFRSMWVPFKTTFLVSFCLCNFWIWNAFGSGQDATSYSRDSNLPLAISKLWFNPGICFKSNTRFMARK